MKIKNILFGILMTIMLSTLSSCKMQKQIPYFKNLETTTGTITTVESQETTIKKHDILTITVSSLDPLAAAPFNLPLVSYSNPGSETVASGNSLQPYIVDNDGYITFPVIGKMKLAGMKKSEAIEYIKNSLSPYLKDPIITIQFTNYRISILGEVRSPGAYTISNEHVTILDALAMAGDMTLYGRRENVLLIREKDNGDREYIRFNLNNTDIMDSPYFYLEQNDVIYVEPNAIRATAASNTNVSLYFSGASTLATLATVIISVVSLLNK